MSDADDEEEGALAPERLPDGETCDRLTKEFAEVTGTDEALGHFLLQDCGWKLEVLHFVSNLCSSMVLDFCR